MKSNAEGSSGLQILPFAALRLGGFASPAAQHDAEASKELARVNPALALAATRRSNPEKPNRSDGVPFPAGMTDATLYTLVGLVSGGIATLAYGLGPRWERARDKKLLKAYPGIWRITSKPEEGGLAVELEHNWVQGRTVNGMIPVRSRRRSPSG